MIYIFKHPETDEYKEIIQGMNDDHVYSEEGKNWKRVFTNPNMSIDTHIDAFSKKDFMKKTEKNKGKMGDLYDLSAELSAKRAEKNGDDPIRRKYLDNYEKKNKTKHPKDKPKNFETKHISVEF